MTHSQQGRVLGIDYGSKRVGLAISDPGRSMVFPRGTVLHEGMPALLGLLRDFCVREEITLIVIGLPYDDRHVENDQTARVQKFGDALQEAVGTSVVYEDEKYTSAEAEALLSSHGIGFRSKKLMRDSVAAMLIVQSYLNRV